ncbi:MAG: GTP 3',8-cyclase MoaA [Verrucomicrobiota bacterium]
MCWYLAMTGVMDSFGRPLRELRVSVTDRCNFRCGYCMPAELFGPGYAFLPGEELLTFDEIERVARIAVSQGVGKVRLTGGEPLLRRGIEDLVAQLACIPGLDDLAMTTNGTMLAHKAETLALAGLQRVTVSLDALDAEIFGRMNGTGADVTRVLAGIEAAWVFGLPVKINAVIRRGWNDGEILPLAEWARERGITLRFIEYMDVGETNGWRREEMVPAEEILSVLRREWRMDEIPGGRAGGTALRFRHADGGAEVGIIASVTRPFCGDCARSRLSADGRWFTCLFAGSGHDLKPMLRGGASDAVITAAVRGVWSARDDRYSELRGVDGTLQRKAEMSYLGG